MPLQSDPGWAGLATGAGAAPAHPRQVADGTGVTAALAGTGVTAALTQGAGPGSHPARQINTANCLPGLNRACPVPGITDRL